MNRPPQPRSTLFPYTTLFRSLRAGVPASGSNLNSVTTVMNQQYSGAATIGTTTRPASNQGLIQLDRKSTRLNSSHPSISYAVFCLKKKQEAAQHQHRPPFRAA